MRSVLIGCIENWSRTKQKVVVYIIEYKTSLYKVYCSIM